MCCALLLTAFLGCKPELKLDSDFDIPQNKSLNTANGLENALQSAYALLRSKDNFGGAWIIWPEIMADQVIYNPGSPVSTPELNIFRRNIQPTDSIIVNSWRNAYRAIAICNSILRACDEGKISDADFQSNKPRFVGEARFLRALVYFHLVRFFAPQYDESTKNVPAIPLPTIYFDELRNEQLASVSDVYNLILSDFKSSIENLTQAGRIQNSTTEEEFKLGGGLPVFNRPTVHIARGFLAKVYAQMDSKLYANEIIDEINQIFEDKPNDSLDLANHGPPDRTERYFPQPYPLFGIGKSALNGMFSSNFGRGTAVSYNNRYESMFSMMNSGDFEDGLNTFNYISRRFTYIPESPAFNTKVPFVPTVNIDVLNRRRYDLRFSTFFARSSAATQIYLNGSVVGRFILIKYQGDYVNIPLLRSADLLLLRAEARIQKGELKRSIYDLGFVVFRSIYVKTNDSIQRLYAGANAGNKAYFFRRLVDERQREFYLEGDRLHTLRRLKLEIPQSERGSSIPWTAPELIFPIPVSETSSNTKLN